MIKLFVIGYNKTGTKSLAKALDILGYKVLHTGGGGEFLEKVGWNLFNGKSDKKEQLKQQDLTLQEPAPEVINLAAGGDQQTQNGSSGTGGLGGNVPKIPSNNNDIPVPEEISSVQKEKAEGSFAEFN